MKSQPPRVIFASLILFMASALFVSAQEQPNGTQLTKEQVKALSQNAKTSQDHLALASYFRNEAREAEDMAQLHEEMLTGYKADPAAGTTTELQMHSQEFVNSARRAAASANEMAREQEAIAAQLQQNASTTK